ncbi:uncharacterized protein [Drosophila tropicalis]|uniref:uncharacterized protein n=1 Tax=Drosophila tropicalis TaxID=46794 RepID=UPI0035AC113D
MSNGVELIIASEKVKYMEKQSSTSHPFKFGNGHVISTVGLQSQQQKPLTLSPSTLKNQMFLALPSVKQKQKFTIPKNDNQFITKTCLTTYTYHTTYLQNGTSIVVSKESVISNRHTEERNLFQASTILPTDVILSRTPELVVGVFPTTYHYFNTILDADNEEEDVENALPIVITSKYTILNTVTGPEDYISYLQPSELATPTHDTNTYFSRIAFTKTLQNEFDPDTPKILITENILTQVIVTESLPSRGALAWKSSSAMSYSHTDTDLHIYATKTILTTLTFYKTNSDELTTRTALATPPVPSSQTTRPPEQANDVNKLSTRVVENIVTNTVASSLLRPELISRFRAELLQKKGKTHPNVIVTMATLLGGQTLQITAVNAANALAKPTSITKSRKRTTTAEDIKSKPTIKPSKKNSIEPHQTKDQKSHTPIQTSSIKRTRVQETLVPTQVHSHSHTSIDDDQVVSESEDKDVYVRPSPDLQPSTDSVAIPVQQFLGSFDLKRLRPMLNVMANLLQKNIVNRHRTQPLSVATLPKDSIPEAKNPSITANFDGPAPVYIPLKISGNVLGHFATTNLPIIDGNQHPPPLPNEVRLPDTADSANVNKLTAHSLHIHPPNLDFSQLTADDELLQQNLKNVSHYRFPFSNTADPHHTSLLSQDIPIRPGEIITANADIIIEQDQRVAYTILNTAILNSQKPEVPEFIVHVAPTESNSKKWKSSIKIEDLHQGKPFVLRSQTASKPVSSSGVHQIFIAKGEHFHRQPYTESTTRFNQPKSNSRVTTYVSSSPIVSTNSKVYNPHTNIIASTPRTPYSPLYTAENILKYSLHQKTSSADKFHEVPLPVNNGYSSPATSTRINTKPLQTSTSTGHSPVAMTKPIIESRPKPKTSLSPSLSSTLKNLHSMRPQPTTTQRYSTINVSRSKTSKIKTENQSVKKLEPSEIFEQNSQLMSKTKTELITPTFAPASKEKNSIHRSTQGTHRISSTIKLNQHSSAVPVLSPNYISKSGFDNSFQLTDLQPHKTDPDLERYNEIPLESSEFVISSSVRHDNTPLTNRTLLHEVAKIEPTPNSGITHPDEKDTSLIQTSINPLKTSKAKTSKTSNLIVKTVPNSTHTRTVTKVAENSLSNQTYPSRLVPTIATTSVRLNSTGLPQKVVIKSIIKATVDVHYLKPINPESNKKISDKKERKTTVATSKPSTLKTNVISVVENGADIAAVANRKGNSGPKGDVDISYEYAARDEEILPPIDSNSVLLGGVLIDSPRNPHFKTSTNTKNVPTSNESSCSPACRSSKNEICISVTSESHCECRPGFARMFPDRPCKPTYTYELNLQTNRVGTYQLLFSDTLKGNSSNEYRHLSSIILDAVDRMVMQSDFRDIYHGVQLKSIDTDNEIGKNIVGKFLLQLSESSDLKRLETVFKKYLRQSNYSIGGTELYTSKDGINSLAIADFDECVHDNFNDCSLNAHCFNLIGSYTCSCSDGFVDISTNAIYPGRQCSDSIIGCDKCNYNGKCVAMSGEKGDVESATTICRCFPWHAGATWSGKPLAQSL